MARGHNKPMLHDPQRYQREIANRDARIRVLIDLLLILLAIVVILASMLIIVTKAQASAACMTRAEARTTFPKSHLWYHGPNHCWDNNSGRTSVYRRHRIAPDVMPVHAEAKQIDIDANGNASKDGCCWPSLKELFLDRWRVIMDQFHTTP